jgi:hypothetical protein
MIGRLVSNERFVEESGIDDFLPEVERLNAWLRLNRYYDSSQPFHACMKYVRENEEMPSEQLVGTATRAPYVETRCRQRFFSSSTGLQPFIFWKVQKVGLSSSIWAGMVSKCSCRSASSSCFCPSSNHLSKYASVK